MWCVPALLQTFFNKSVSFSCGVIYFCPSCDRGSVFKGRCLFSFFPSLGGAEVKESSRVVRAVHREVQPRGRRVWAEDERVRPGQLRLQLGLKPLLSLSPTLWFTDLCISASLGLDFSLRILPPHENSLLSVRLSSYILLCPKKETSAPDSQTPTDLCTHPATLLVTFNHRLCTSMVTAAVTMEIFNKPRWAALCFRFEMATRISATNYLL